MPENRRNLVLKACKLMGHDRVAVALGVDEQTVVSWIAGKEEVPEDKLLALAQVALEFAGKAGR